MSNGNQEKTKEFYDRYESTAEWYKVRLKSEGTKHGYIRPMELYCEIRGKNPDELRDEALGLIKEDPGSIKEIIKKIIDFQNFLIESPENYANGTVYHYRCAIQSFYSHVLSRSLKVPNFPNFRKTKTNSHFLKRLELRKILEFADLQGKAILLFQAFTGMRINDILKLKVVTVSRILKEDIDYLVIRYDPQKDSDLIGKRFTILPPTGVMWLKRYLKNRLDDGEVFDEDSPLFRSRKDHKRHITQVQVNNILTDLTDKAEIITDLEKKSNYKITSHSLRKYFNSTMKNDGMQESFIEFMIGHKVPNVQSVYWQPDESKVIEEYKKHIHAIDPYFDDEKNMLKKENKSLTDRVIKIEKVINKLLTKLSSDYIFELLKDEGGKQDPETDYSNSNININGISYDFDSLLDHNVIVENALESV